MSLPRSNIRNKSFNLKSSHEYVNFVGCALQRQKRGLSGSVYITGKRGERERNRGVKYASFLFVRTQTVMQYYSSDDGLPCTIAAVAAPSPIVREV
jgi:hypothetical protein